MFPYIPTTPEDKEKMLGVIGVDSVEDLFSDIPENLRLKDYLNINPPMSELEVSRNIKCLANKNKSTDELVCFLGAGSYDHYIPSIVHHIASRSEFYTAYTPYQPEISQGTLQSIFEYQSMIAELTDMEVSNASMYDEGTALAEACLMSVAQTKKKKVIISNTINPDTMKVIETYLRNRGIEILIAGSDNGATCKKSVEELIDNKTACVVVQNPNFFGVIEDLDEIAEVTHENKALFVMSVDPISLAILKTPGKIGADIVVGSAQPLGNAMNFGGPYIGFMATTKKLMRKMPGRIVGETVDKDGKRAYVLTLQAREQHIRRETATSNICSNQGLNALMAAIYMATMGKEGLREVAEQCIKKSHYAMNEITKSGKYKQVFDRPFFKEFVVTSDTCPCEINDYLLNVGILGGYPLNKASEEAGNGLLLCVTEKRTKKEIDKLVEAMEVM
ncbi:MAG: aminomethyl-transferring glycine dehydrogenase subunit GcvPA [Clostridioides sp.]|jgi:glycine dehydrogenase subunit 1|nr:aminomethyl-transferring glycine dehydrogenase subunit GcvPA [Clostridioides sp.]